MSMASQAAHDRRPREAQASAAPVRTLAVDIGASRIKAVILNELGEPVTGRTAVKTPRPAAPDALWDAIAGLAREQGPFDRVSVGFPGVVQRGVAKRAPNLAPGWRDVNIVKALAQRLGKPVRVCNDADMQGFGAILGHGVEMVLTLGTGVGTSLFVDGRLVPNLEAGNRKLGAAALKKAGRKKWLKRLVRAVARLERMFHYDKLYLGGGHSRCVKIHKLPSNVTIVSNLNGLVGGIALWRDQDKDLESDGTGTAHP